MSLPGFTAAAALPPPAPPAIYLPRTNVALALPCIYGRWCGPGCSGPGPPIDDVDACCESHDQCYATRGYFACSCDSTLVNCVAPKMDVWTAKGRAAIAVFTWFSRGWCNPWA